MAPEKQANTKGEAVIMGNVAEAFAEVRSRVEDFKNREQSGDTPLNMDIIAGMNHVLNTMTYIQDLYDTDEKQAEPKEVKTHWTTRLEWALDDLLFPAIPRVAALALTSMILANFIWIVRHWEK